MGYTRSGEMRFRCLLLALPTVLLPLSAAFAQTPTPLILERALRHGYHLWMTSVQVQTIDNFFSAASLRQDRAEAAMNGDFEVFLRSREITIEEAAELLALEKAVGFYLIEIVGKKGMQGMADNLRAFITGAGFDFYGTSVTTENFIAWLADREKISLFRPTDRFVPGNRFFDASKIEQVRTGTIWVIDAWGFGRVKLLSTGIAGDLYNSQLYYGGD